MKIELSCLKCKEIDIDSFLNETVTFKSIPQDFIIEAYCKHNHQSIIHLIDPLYSLLFDNCVIAYHEQNYRSSIFEAASSLERFYEHAIRILIIDKKDLANPKTIEDFKSSWKLIKNMSERQIGAFVMLFHKTTNKAPLILDDKFTKLRNDTIHKGYLPNQDEAYNFLTKVYDIIQFNRYTVRLANEDAFWLLEQRVDFENMIAPHLENAESLILQHSGAHFFNSAFGKNLKESLQNYYNKHLKSP